MQLHGLWPDYGSLYQTPGTPSVCSHNLILIYRRVRHLTIKGDDVDIHSTTIFATYPSPQRPGFTLLPLLRFGRTSRCTRTSPTNTRDGFSTAQLVRPPTPPVSYNDITINQPKTVLSIHGQSHRVSIIFHPSTPCLWSHCFNFHISKPPQHVRPSFPPVTHQTVNPHRIARPRPQTGAD